MKKLIHKYLNEYFYVAADNVSRINNNSRFYPVSAHHLVLELTKIFGLDKKELKWYVKSWILKHSKSFKFNPWWTPVSRFDVYIPLARQVHAQTIASELVAVQPLGEPRGILNYLEYHRADTAFDQGYVYAPYIPVDVTPEVVDPANFNPTEITSRYATRTINPNYYGTLDHNGRTPEETVRWREDTVRRWQESGLLDGLRGSSIDSIEQLYQSQAQQLIR